MLNLLLEINVPYLVIQYVIYGSIFIVGLIILIIMKRISKKPVTATAITQTKKAIEKVDALLSDGEKVSDYMFPAKILQLSSVVGDLLLLADKEFTTNKNIAYEGVLGAYVTASKRLDEIALTWERETSKEPLEGVKNDLQRALNILEQIANPRKK